MANFQVFKLISIILLFLNSSITETVNVSFDVTLNNETTKDDRTTWKMMLLRGVVQNAIANEDLYYQYFYKMIERIIKGTSNDQDLANYDNLFEGIKEYSSLSQNEIVTKLKEVLNSIEQSLKGKGLSLDIRLKFKTIFKSEKIIWNKRLKLASLEVDQLFGEGKGTKNYVFFSKGEKHYSFATTSHVNTKFYNAFVLDELNIEKWKIPGDTQIYETLRNGFTFKSSFELSEGYLPTLKATFDRSTGVKLKIGSASKIAAVFELPSETRFLVI